MKAARLAGALTVIAIAQAHAQPAKDAEELAAHGNYIGAAAKFREAFAADPRPDLMCNVGVAYYKAKDLPRAHRYLEQCVSIGKSLDAGFISTVQQVLDAVAAKLGEGEFTAVDLVVEPASAVTTIVGGVPFDEPIVGNLRVWFPYGTYKLAVHAEGYTDKTLEIVAKTHDPQRAAVKLEKPAVVVAPPPPRPEPKPVPRSKTPAWIATGATTVIGLGSLGAWYLAYQRKQDAIALNGVDETKFNTAVDKGKKWLLLAQVGGVVTGLGAIASGYLWYRATRSETRVELVPAADGASVSISGSW